MSQVVNILEGGALAAAGGAVCFLLVWWRERGLKEAKRVESEALLAKARSEAETLLHEARSAASQEALHFREQIEQSFTARRAERAELETRLAQREALINSQLERIVEAEKQLNEQKAALRKRA